ncbi:PepSY domain-containing protein [Streptomyces sp. AC512_CC834]|uniref:PepSY domain-containing protein n=1 Tax=Streptomyces sp. AC512_CC834 TaxID=2823691 RepID=UPI001C25D108|nr:PepSY domain-containing protein [Streptomyces sp. AC512_CC834]
MKRNIVIAAVTAAALVGGGTATALATTGDDDRGTASKADASVPGDVTVSDDGGVLDESDDRDDTARVSSAKVTVADAIASALRDTPGTAVSAELDDEDDEDYDGDGDDRRERAVWEVDVLSGDGTWHSVRIDPASGTVLGSHTDHEDDTAEVRTALKGASVDAVEAAKAAAGHGTVTSVDLDEDGDDDGNGKPAWEVETRTAGKGEQDWRVDLKTGKVTADSHSDDSHSDGSDDSDSDHSDDSDDD